MYYVTKFNNVTHVTERRSFNSLNEAQNYMVEDLECEEIGHAAVKSELCKTMAYLDFHYGTSTRTISWVIDRG